MNSLKEVFDENKELSYTGKIKYEDKEIGNYQLKIKGLNNIDDDIKRIIGFSKAKDAGVK